MTERVKRMLEILKSREYRKNRSVVELDIDDIVKDMSYAEQKAYALIIMLDNEEPVLHEGDRIGFYRHRSKSPSSNFSIDGNFTPNYERYLREGFGGVYEKLKSQQTSAEGDRRIFIDTALMQLDSFFNYCKRLRDVASGDLKDVLLRLPQNAPQSYYEALVMLKAIIYFLRCADVAHVTLGRFDQYMYSFYKMDVERGMSHDEFLELTEEFFVSINFDGDLYPGMQTGDNGQSMVLGGIDMQGRSMFNELSKICMEASMDLNLIDPKINLRVNKDTPMSIYLLGTQMTKMGLGFPQYNNDDIIIDGLISLGYTPEEAYNYAVAACWEYIVPNAYDVPNIGTMNFPKVINDTIYAHLAESESFDEFKEYVSAAIEAECDRLVDEANGCEYTPNTTLSLFCDPCIDQGKDYSTHCAYHNNFGFHGAGIANAADALAAVKKLVFEEKSLTAETLMAALDADFEGYEDVHKKLTICPKMGNNDDYVDLLGCYLMEQFCEHMNGRQNARGGICRAGTGSAMEYILSSKDVGATADGRRANTPYSSSFSPAITTRLDGPLSTILSFTKFDMKKIVNGGPLTMEIHDTTFRNDYGIEKVAQLVKMFIELGGQQLQLNAINRDRLLDAQKHTENYPNLIVRVWGWSGYFGELDIEYQNHIISRTEFMVV